MLYRKRARDIDTWIQTDDKEALLVTGARQTGKTFLIRNRLEAAGLYYVEFNFIERPDIVKLLQESSGLGAKEVLVRLSALSPKPFKKGETVIFLDEIQEYKEIVTLIKFLVDEGSYRYVLSGSLLGVELFDLRSAPVGYMRTIDMFPLDIEEFYLAMNLSREVIEMLRNCYDSRTAVSEAVHRSLMENFYKYIIVGGMPKAVQSFIDDGDLNRVMEIQKEIIREYERDFTKYEDRYKKLKLRRIYELIPAEIADKNKRYIFTDLDKNHRPERYESSFEWLDKAGVAIPVYNASAPQVPLKANEKSNLFKLFLSDVGLLTARYGNAMVLSILDGSRNLNCGAVFENVVAQELKAHGYDGYYFNSKKQGELDFVIEHRGRILPIEVKSGKDYTRHSALDNVLSVPEYNIKDAIVFSAENVSVSEGITYLPIYMLMFLNESETPLPVLGKQDLMLTALEAFPSRMAAALRCPDENA